MATETSIEIRKQLISVMREAFPQLDPRKKVNFGTQTSHGSIKTTFRQPSSQISRSAEDMPDCAGDIELDETMNEKIIIRPPSYETAVSTMAADELELTNLLASFVSDSVRATLQQDHNPQLAAKVEEGVTEVVVQRQMSIDENKRILQLQSENIGTPM